MIPSAWSTPIKRGYRVGWHATIEGLRYVWTERALLTVEGADPGLPTGYVTACPALAIADGEAVSCEVDRQTGVASGRAWDLHLGVDALERQGLLSALFRRPAKRARLTADEATGTATTLDVDSTTGWSGTGTAYVGLETVTYGGTTATSFTGLTRGVCSRVHPHYQSSPHSQRWVTDTPVLWVGRLVTLWAHLESPDGYVLANDLATAGAYCVEAWVGQVDAPPAPGAAGFTLRCLPIVRALARDIGAAVIGKVALSDTGTVRAGDAWIVTSPGDAISVTVETEASGVIASVAVPADIAVDRVDTIGGWAADLAAELGATLGAGWWVDAQVFPAGIYVTANAASGYGLWTRITLTVPDSWWLRPGTYTSEEADGGAGVGIPFAVHAGAVTGWLPVTFDSSEDWQAVEVGQSGALSVEADGTTEIVRWDAALTGPPRGVHFLRISERGALGARAPIWTDGAKVQIVTGSRASMAQVLGELVESSGLTVATRGTYDTLGLGYGLGLPGSRVDYASLASHPWASLDVDGSASEAASIEERLGGWLALAGQCLVQRTSDAGTVQIVAVSTVPLASGQTAEIGRSDVLLDGTQPSELVEAPTTVRVEHGEDSTVTRDLPLIEAGGERTWTLSCGGCDAVTAHVYSLGLIAITDGQAVLEVEVGPWVQVRVGEVVTLTTAHPLAYDWTTGARGVSTTIARVAGWACSLVSGVQTLTLLLPGAGAAVGALCPSAVVQSVGGTDEVTVQAGHGGYFAADDDVTTYTPGDDGTATQQTLATVAGDVLTFTGAHGLAAGDVVTYPVLAGATAAQAAWAYRDSGTVWR